MWRVYQEVCHAGVHIILMVNGKCVLFESKRDVTSLGILFIFDIVDLGIDKIILQYGKQNTEKRK